MDWVILKKTLEFYYILH